MIYNKIIHRINESSGWLSFDKLMLEALYLYSDSYYIKNNTDKTPFGKKGDFITSASLGPWLGKVLAKRFKKLVSTTPNFLRNNLIIREFGPGTGELALEILIELDQVNCLPHRYEFYEVSSSMITNQKKTIELSIERFSKDTRKKIMDLCFWKLVVPEPNKFIPDKYELVNGLVIANEVVDSFPVKIFSWEPKNQAETNKILEYGVSVDGNGNMVGKFNEACAALRENVLKRCTQSRLRGKPWKNPRLGEWNVYTKDWIRKVLDSFDYGAAVIIDYGSERLDIDHSERRDTTVSAFSNHHQISDLNEIISRTGNIDITHQVDFTSLIEEITKDKELTFTLQTQAAWLIDNGILEDAEKLFLKLENNNLELLELKKSLQYLLLESEMGSSFLVLDILKEY
tara:strand:- start:39242 stop:40441 length:1200 start_codon:yes stop_codon:yes gene_type:complete